MYNCDGRLIRQYKDESKIIEPQTFIFYYDFEGVAAFKYTDKNNNGTMFFYLRDGQGNIIAIVDSTGSVVVQYYYDAWGNHKVVDENGDEITSSTHIGNLNPFRYRGYYYDTETGLYFLQTRYYDPEVGRFLNRDSVQYADPETINGLNLYAYCLNNPVMYINDSIFSVVDGIATSSTIGVDSGGISLQSVRSAPEWLKIGVGAIPDIILGLKYLRAKGIHNKFVYSSNEFYIFPELGAKWHKYKISKYGYGKIACASLKQIFTGNARAGWGAVVKSLGKTAALTGLINFGFNLYENNWQIDGAMLLDTVIDTAIGLGAYGLAAGTTSLVASGLAMAGLAIPGVVVVGGIILLSIGFDWLIREIVGYKN